MIHHIIKTRTPLTRKRISNYITSFFKEVDLNTKYIKVRITLQDINSNKYNLGEAFIVDITRTKSINSYKTIIFDQYLKFLLLDRSNEIKITRFIFEYKPMTTLDLTEGNKTK